MFFNVLASAVLLLDVVAATGAGSVCSSAPYIQISSILATYSPAQQFCSSKYPLPTPICTAYSTKTNTVTIHTTITTPSATQTVFQTTGSPSTDTITVSVDGGTVTSTVTSDYTHVNAGVDTVEATSTTTQTNYIKKRGMTATNSAKCSNTLAALTKSAFANVVSTACSCIETTPACKTTTLPATTVKTITATSTVYTTFTTTDQVPDTSINTVSVSVTLPPSVTTTTSTTTLESTTYSTTTTTETSIVTVIASSSAAAAPASSARVQCNPAQADGSYMGEGGCSSDCYCDHSTDNIHAYCASDDFSDGDLIYCSSDADCPSTEFCDLTLHGPDGGTVCDTSAGCSSTYTGSSKRSAFDGLATWAEGGRNGRLQRRSVDRTFTMSNGTVVKLWTT